MRGIGLVVALALLMTGCSSLDPDAWVVTPIVVDHGVDEPTDVSYFIDRIADDTAGGFWTESQGSWFHIDAEGMTAARFNTEFLVETFAALSPTELLVSQTGVGMRVFNTETQTLSPSPMSEDGADLIAIADDGGVVVARFTTEAVRVIHLDGSGEQREVAVLETIRTGPVSAMDIAPDGSVVLASSRGLTTVTPQGELVWEAQSWDGTPVVTIDESGAMILRAVADAAPSSESFRVDGGSGYARDVLEAESSSVDGPLAIRTENANTVLAFTAGSTAALATRDGAFIYIRPGPAGDESILAGAQP